jgi:DNA-binding protein HU-beta
MSTSIQVIGAVAERAGLDKTTTERVLDGFVQTVQQELAAGNEVRFKGFGKFVTSKRPARTGRNPRTGATVDVPEKTIVKFKPASELRDALQTA